MWVAAGLTAGPAAVAALCKPSQSASGECRNVYKALKSVPDKRKPRLLAREPGATCHGHGGAHCRCLISSEMINRKMYSCGWTESVQTKAGRRFRGCSQGKRGFQGLMSAR